MTSLWQRFFNQRTLLIIVIMVGVAWFLSIRQGRFADDAEYAQYEQIRLQGDNHCDVTSAACIKAGDDMRMSLALLDKPSGLRPFPVQVSIESPQSLQAAKVKLLFSMTDMQMGDLKQTLAQDNDSGHWMGNAILPICTSGRSDWHVQVEVIIEKKIYLADYQFVLKK